MMNKYEKTLEEFLETTTYEPIKKEKDRYKTVIKNIKGTLSTITNENVITWEFIYNEISKKRCKALKRQYLIAWVLYTIELDKKGYLKGSLAGQVAENAEAISIYVKEPF